MTQLGRIADGGMGGFLCPPGHPEHIYHVETDLRRRKANRGGMALSSAVETDYLPDDVRQSARGILMAWETNHPVLDSEEVQDWVHQILGHFLNCYAGPQDGESAWHASNLQISAQAVPMLLIDAHAGVHHIRRYYPEFTPTQEHFDRAYWGSKPEA